MILGDQEVSVPDPASVPKVETLPQDVLQIITIVDDANPPIQKNLVVMDLAMDLIIDLPIAALYLRSRQSYIGERSS